MKYREEHSANIEEQALAGRRRFMGRALMGGMAAFVPAARVNFNNAESQTCTATAADSLVFYLTLLLQIPYELLKGSGTDVGTAADLCAKQLKDINAKVQELDAEIRGSQSKAQTARLRHPGTTPTTRPYKPPWNIAIKAGSRSWRVIRGRIAWIMSRQSAMILKVNMEIPS